MSATGPRELANIPPADTPVPARVRSLAGDAALEPVWINGLGGVTFRATDGDGIRFVKYGPRNAETTMAGEAERMAWAAPFTPVPRVLAQGSDETHEWLVTAAAPGESAVAPRWIDDPEPAVRAIGAGLRALHDALPMAVCPYDWGVPGRVENAARRGVLVPAPLRDAPAIDRLVVCHGDACAPNTLLDENGCWRAHVDLGALGVADRWSDIAVAALSLGWNYGPGWEPLLLEAYGITPDRERLDYYAALWEAT